MELIQYYPDINTVARDFGPATVGPGVEYPYLYDIFSVNVFKTKMVNCQYNDVTPS